MSCRAHALARGAAILALLLCAAPATAQSPSEAPAVSHASNDRPSRLRALLATEAVLHSADMFTTVYTLQLGDAREGNPLLAPFAERPAALVAISGAVNVLQLYTISKLQRRHPKMAVAWAVILIGAEAFAVTNNVRIAGQLRRDRARR